MDLGNWMVAVLTLAAVCFVVGLEVHCRRNQRQREQERKRAQDPAAVASEPGTPE